MSVGDRDTGWEPKVAKLEATIEAVTRDIASLTSAVSGLGQTVRDLAENTAKHFESLLVSVTAATGPRRTDWQVVIAAGVLVLALSAAVIAPLSQRLNEIQLGHEMLEARFYGHERLPLHPVGATRVDLLDRLINERIDTLTKEFDHVRVEGSPVTRERLSVLESLMRAAEVKKP